MPPFSPRRGRFQSLDIVRGIAALMVTLFHCVNSLPDVNESLAGRMLMRASAGVFLFFPVSGYCIAAALQRSENATFRAFLKRRWRRIYPPYWASLVVAVLVALAALPFNTGALSDLWPSTHLWAAALTLTQTFTSRPGFLNPVYWSLCYEEQFYLMMAALLLTPPGRRPLLLTLLTLVSVVYVFLPEIHVPGLFLDLWVCFAAGCAAFLILEVPSGRGYGWTTLAMIVTVAWVHEDLSVAISIAGAAVMLLIARWDDAIAGTRMLAPLMRLGTISFSLYLVHAIVVSKIVNLLGLRLQLGIWITVAVSVATSLVTATAFFLVVERRFIPRRSRSAPALAAAALQ